MRKRLLAISFILLILLCGCGATDESTTSDYQTITANEAYDMMQEKEEAIILDVRTQKEFDEGHIPNALLIPDNEIREKAESILTDKEATILVYCRSGRRSALAAKELAALGYKKIYDFGGIIDWNYNVVA
ncbi:rhodanese-like domain-containing protein [Anaerotignum sp.]|uniref:rhodanese-like domain-containing protein n=1 Tax=Anaerotignum sp. TaxID=2039241 RepID=UPI00331DED26